MTTLNPRTPTSLPVLYADEYGKSSVLYMCSLYLTSLGFHNGIRLWRGYFNGTATGVFLNVQGGSAL